MRRKTEEALLELGITPNLRGFHYICEAVELINKEEVVRTTELYRIISERRSVELANVERAVRHAISKINAGSTAYDKYLGISSRKNSEVLFTLAMKLKGGLSQ